MRSFLVVVTAFIAAAAGFWPQSAQARVFDFNSETLSTYLRGTFGTSNLQQTAYQPGFPSSVSFTGNANLGYSGEIGIAFSSSHAMTVRLGVELLYPAEQTAATGTNSSGATLMTIDSQTYAVIPQLNIEPYIKKWANSRFYLGGGVGYAVTTIKNTVTMTAQGTSTLGLSNYIEEGTGWGIMGQGYLGYELALFDNVSFSIDLGYRYLTVSNYTANRSFTSPEGSIANGNPITNSGGGNRYTDLGGAFGAANFRFYIY